MRTPARLLHAPDPHCPVATFHPPNRHKSLTPATAAWWTQTVSPLQRLHGGPRHRHRSLRARRKIRSRAVQIRRPQARRRRRHLLPASPHASNRAWTKTNPQSKSSAPQANHDILHFTTEVTTVPREQPSLIEAPMIFVGYGMPPADLDLKGKIAVFFNKIPPGCHSH